MSYGYKILKTKQSELVPIPLEQLNQVVNSRDGWRLGQKKNEFQFQGKIGEFSVQYEDGVIWAFRIGGRTLEELISIANLLDARVVGEEYESYETADKSYIHPDDQNERLKFESEMIRVAALPRSKPLSLSAQRIWGSLIYMLILYSLFGVWHTSESNYAVWFIRIGLTLIVFPIVTFLVYRTWRKSKS